MDTKQILSENRLSVLITLIDRGSGEEVSGAYRGMGLTYNIISPGYGAIGLEPEDYLGFTEIEKDMIISIGADQIVKQVIATIHKGFLSDYTGNGIAFTVPLKGISGIRALQYVTGSMEGRPLNE